MDKEDDYSWEGFWKPLCEKLKPFQYTGFSQKELYDMDAEAFGDTLDDDYENPYNNNY